MKPVPGWFVAICWVMAIGFSVCVGLQYNDPDPLRWFAIYGAAAISFAALPSRRWFSAVTAVVGLIAAIWAAYLGHEVKNMIEVSDLWMRMNEKGGAVEVGREAGGLVLIAATTFAGATFRALRA